MGRKTMSRTELVSMIGQLNEYQVEQIRKMAEEFLIIQEELRDTTPISCSYCNSTSTRFIKKIFSGRKQRYQCMEHISVCHATAFFTRKKLIAFLEKAVQGDTPSGLIEADETNILEHKRASM